MGRPPLPVGTHGTISAKQDGQRYMAWCKFRDRDGQVRKVRCWASSKEKAKNTLRERVRDRQVSTGEIKPDTKVIDVATRWFAEFREQIDAGTRSETSFDTYQHRWEKLLRPRLQGLRIRELNAGRVDGILREINGSLSASSAKTCRTIISGLCGLAVRHEALPSNPVREVRTIERKRPKAAVKALTVDEALKLFELVDSDAVAVRQDLPDIMRYLAGTGYRTGEVLAIRWENIDFDGKVAYMAGNMVRTKAQGKTVNDGKTEMAQRAVPLADWLVTMLLDRRERIAADREQSPNEVVGWVFPNSLGGLRETNNMRRDWRAFRERHGIGNWFTPRTFRRTVATLLTDALPAREASDLLGHSRVSQTTDTYVGRMAVSRRPAEVLDALGDFNRGSNEAPGKSEPSE